MKRSKAMNRRRPWPSSAGSRPTRRKPVPEVLRDPRPRIQHAALAAIVERAGVAVDGASDITHEAS